jgi:hypothetical protein
MGMIDRQQTFTSFAHLALRGEEVFRGGFVC